METNPNRNGDWLDPSGSSGAPPPRCATITEGPTLDEGGQFVGALVSSIQPSVAIKHRERLELENGNRSPDAASFAKPTLPNWFSRCWIVLLHLGALSSPFFFDWRAVLAMFVLGWVTGAVGICLGYHRLFTHRSFRTYRPVRWLIAWLGTLAGQGPLIDWVATHRKHHARSDRDGDPHSPEDGAWWSHMLWLMWTNGPKERGAEYRRWAPDLMKDPVLRLIDRMYLVSHFLLGAALFGVGYWVGGLHTALAALSWGMFFRLVYVLHSTWFVNSAGHMWGYRNYATRDNSRNLWWVALLAYGEGWHNNHHAYPAMARHGHRWWEFDATFQLIRILAWLGLAWNLVDGQHKKPDRRRARGREAVNCRLGPH